LKERQENEMMSNMQFF